MIIIFTPWEAEEAGLETVAEVSHSSLELPTPVLFKEEWATAKDRVSDANDEYEFTDIVKEMEKLGWTFLFSDTTNVEY